MGNDAYASVESVDYLPYLVIWPYLSQFVRNDVEKEKAVDLIFCFRYFSLFLALRGLVGHDLSYQQGFAMSLFVPSVVEGSDVFHEI